MEELVLRTLVLQFDGRVVELLRPFLDKISEAVRAAR